MAFVPKRMGKKLFSQKYHSSDIKTGH